MMHPLAVLRSDMSRNLNSFKEVIITPIMENQMENKMENEMETAIYIYIYI